MKLFIEVDLRTGVKSASDAVQAISSALVNQSASTFDPLNEHESGTIRDALGDAVGEWVVEDA